MTLLWAVAGLVATLGLFFGATEIWPDLTGVLGHVALIPSLLVSALVGVNHMQSHPRQSDGKGIFWMSSAGDTGLVVPNEGRVYLRAVLFNLMLQRFNSTEVAERITDRIIEEAKNGEPHVRNYLRKNLEFTNPVIDEITDILFRSKCA
jgi:hypothetical protein